MAAPGPWREPGPYSSYPRNHPHSPPQSRPLHPYAAAVAPQRHSYYNATMQTPPVLGFYNATLSQPRPANSIPPSGGGAPVFPEPRIGLPPSLVPGRQPTFAVPRSHSNDFFFQNNDPMAYASRHAQSVPVPPLPRKPDFAQPPLPPKPFFSQSSPVSPSSDPGPSATLYASPEPTPTFAPSAPPLSTFSQPDHDDDAIFNRVLEMSAQEARRSPPDPGPTEAELIARAVQESLRISRPRRVSSPDRQHSIISSSSPPERGTSILSTKSLPNPDADSSGTSSRGGSKQFGGGSSSRAHQITADEALARQLAEEEERLMKEEEEGEEEEEEEERRRDEARSPSLSPPSVSQAANDLPDDGPPQYDVAVASSPPVSASFYSASLNAHISTHGAGPSSPESPTRLMALGRSVSEKPTPPKSNTPPLLGRSQSVAESAPSSSTSLLTPTTPEARPPSAAEADRKPSSPLSTASANADIIANSQTQYLDAELLAGLTLDFGTPPITPSLTPYSRVIPNVIALPYGRCPPFHIKAPSWRNLLKLLARLSGTRLEPTMEAMAVVKTEMKLRVVVSFVKVHHSSSIWHTVLYMTIDHPVPSNAPTGWKYRNGDTNSLPWSYTLSPLPAFLRDGADAPLSRFYTIPATQELPFPALPITFPNLAAYLASALESSRDAMHDSSSGVRRLARCIDQLYPSDHIGVLDDAPERAGMRQRLKNFVGIGSKPQRDRNAEMYELVTPFMPDQHGH